MVPQATPSKRVSTGASQWGTSAETLPRSNEIPQQSHPDHSSDLQHHSHAHSDTDVAHITHYKYAHQLPINTMRHNPQTGATRVT